MFQTDMGEVNIVRQVGSLAQAMVGELRFTERSARPRGRAVRARIMELSLVLDSLGGRKPVCAGTHS